MKIRDLPAAVTAAKADWLPGTTWIGFTPVDDGLSARNQCQSTIQKQFASGYVIEYITKLYSTPNKGYEKDPAYLEERAQHKAIAGRLIAVHKLRTTARRLEEIIGPDDFQALQNMWAVGQKRFRWSVAFPIVESYKIVGAPLAEVLLGSACYHRHFRRSSATLRELDEEARGHIANLDIVAVPTLNAHIGIEDELTLAERSHIDPRTQKLIDIDLSGGAFEGGTADYKRRGRLRAAWLADRFIAHRSRNGTLRCDDCNFDPAIIFDDQGKSFVRRLLDVHHKAPLEEGIRYTTIADYALLCPTCHRVEHARLGLAKKNLRA